MSQSTTTGGGKRPGPSPATRSLDLLRITHLRGPEKAPGAWVIRNKSSTPGGQRRRRPIAQAVSSCREDSCSLRSTEETCVSTVLTEMNSSLATSLYW